MTNYKVVLVGDTAVGKSNLHRKLLSRKFIRGYVATIGVDYAVKSFAIGGDTVMLNVWDTAGQERFQAMTANIYMRQASGVIFVYDMTRRKTFENISRWIRLVEENDTIMPENVLFMLVGNKADLTHCTEVSAPEALDFADRHSMMFMETSAYTGQNVDQMFRIFAAELHNQLSEKQKKFLENSHDCVTPHYDNDNKPGCC